MTAFQSASLQMAAFLLLVAGCCFLALKFSESDLGQRLRDRLGFGGEPEWWD